MKKLLLSILCPLAVVFAGPYDIEEFTAQDAGVPDSYIAAEFGGELTTANPSAIYDLQEGRLIVRQKFEDPFGTEETTYQLYQGQTGSDFSSMTAMSAEGVDYEKLLHAKFYTKRGEDAKNDVPKVYFDGKSVFAEGLTTLIAFVDGSPVTLKGETPEETPVAAATPADSDEYCDDDDPDCEDDDDYSSYNVSSDPSDAAATSNEQYAATDAANEATNRFGIADEVRFWTAVGLSALAGAAAVVGVLQHMKSNEAKDAYDKQNDFIKNVEAAVQDICAEKGTSADCEAAVDWYIKNNNTDLTGGTDNPITYQDLLSRKKTNKNTMDSYATARNIWFGVSAASLTAAIVLFVW